MTELPRPSNGWRVLYHVPRSQVWEGSRGRQTGAVHLHATVDWSLSAKRGRRGSLVRRAGQALCGRHGWYEREVEHESDLTVRCTNCVRMAERYGVDWPQETRHG